MPGILDDIEVDWIKHEVCAGALPYDHPTSSCIHSGTLEAYQHLFTLTQMNNLQALRHCMQHSVLLQKSKMFITSYCITSHLLASGLYILQVTEQSTYHDACIDVIAVWPFALQATRACEGPFALEREVKTSRATDSITLKTQATTHAYHRGKG